MLRAFLFVLLLAGLAPAKVPIATVTAAKSVSVNGVTVATQGVPALPLASGDVIATGNEPAIVKLEDGSIFMLGKISSMKITQCGPMEIEISQGAAIYRFAKASGARFCALGHPVTVSAMTEGSITVESPGKAVLRTVDPRTVSLPASQCFCSKPLAHASIRVAGLRGVTAFRVALAQASSVSPSVPAMPPTSAGWLMMLIAGGTLFGLGAGLLRKR